MWALILLAALLALYLVYRRDASRRIAFLRSLITFAVLAVLFTEIAGAWHAIGRNAFFVCWAIATGVALVIWIRRGVRSTASEPLGRPTLFTAACVLAMTVIAGYIAVTAVLSPPNSADALSYHLPRILYWVQNRSVEFFPTSYLNLIMMQPVAEYVMLHVYSLPGGDQYVNLVQSAAFVGSIVAVSSICATFGLSGQAQAIGALFAATLPNAILQASGAKNDLVLALWLACVVLFAVRWGKDRFGTDLMFLGLAAGLALGTKGTAYLFLPPALAAALLAVAAGGRRISIGELAKAGAVICAGVLLINAPLFTRNYFMSGSALGYDSAHGDGLFRWRNEELGWKALVSNSLRHLTEQLGARSPEWNRRVFEASIRAHHVLGIDPEDPGTTWRWSEYKPPKNSNHEADANNRWHLLVIAAAMMFAAYQGRTGRRWLAYCVAPAGCFLAFAFYLKWQPFSSRLLVPIFMLSAPLAAMMIASMCPVVLRVAVCLLLVSNSRLALTQNWTRPLTGPRAVRTEPRHLLYFNDMNQWNNRGSYLAAVDLTAASGCSVVATDTTFNHVEYPFQALLLQRNPPVRFMHVGVTNASARYGPHEPEDACAVLCLDCAGVAEKVAAYEPHFEQTHQLDRFLLFLRPTRRGLSRVE